MAIQYKLVADEIGRNIAAQRYGDTLAPVRELADQFQVSLHTVQRALQVLSQRSLVVADSTRGIRIIHRPSSRIIGVFCNFRKGNSNDLVVRALRRLIEADGYEAIFVDIPEKVCNEVDGVFWRYGWADGYISLYGTSDTNIDLCLQSFRLPAVTANHAYRKADLSCVDFDHCRLLRELAEGLYARGFRKIALSFTICSRRISEEVNAEFAAFLSRYGLSVPPEWITEGCEQDIKIPREARIARQFAAMLESPENRPEAIICFHHGLKFAAALAQQYGVELGKELTLAGTGSGDLAMPGVLPVEFSYQELAAGLWQLLKKHLNQPNAPSETVRLPPPEIRWESVTARGGAECAAEDRNCSRK